MATAFVSDATEDEDWVVGNLESIFPQFARPVLLEFVQEADDGSDPFQRDVVLNRCIENILSLPQEEAMIVDASPSDTAQPRK